MNDARRKAIRDASALLTRAMDMLAAALDEEQEYFDNMPEAFQGGERGEKVQTAIECLESVCSDLEAFDLEDALA